MSQSDEEIKKFFAEMRTTDNIVPIPDFDETKKNHQPKRRFLLPFGIAASLVIMVGTYFIVHQPQDRAPSVELIISLGKEEAISTEGLITIESPIDSWTSPTSSLIDDF